MFPKPQQGRAHSKIYKNTSCLQWRPNTRELSTSLLFLSYHNMGVMCDNLQSMSRPSLSFQKGLRPPTICTWRKHSPSIKWREAATKYTTRSSIWASLIAADDAHSRREESRWGRSTRKEARRRLHRPWGSRADKTLSWMWTRKTSDRREVWREHAGHRPISGRRSVDQTWGRDHGASLRG